MVVVVLFVCLCDCVCERVFFWECTCRRFVKYNSSWVTNIFTCRQYLNERYELFLYWPIEIIVKDKALTQWLKKLHLFLREKNIKKETKEKRIKELIYATIIVRTFGHKKCSYNWVRRRLLPIEWMLQLPNLVGRVGVLPLILFLFFYFFWMLIGINWRSQTMQF